jgi:hypothetical protein
MANDTEDPPGGKRDTLQKMRDQRDALNARIRQAEARLAKSARDEDTRLKVWIGACVKWEAEHEAECLTWLRERFFAFYRDPEQHAVKHEAFNRLVKPATAKPPASPPDDHPQPPQA